MAGAGGVLELQVAGGAAVYVAHGALHLPQADLNGAAGIGHVLGAEDDQGAVAGAALGITGQLDLHDLAVGGLHRLVSGKNLGTGAGTVTDDADGAVLGVDVHLLVDLMVHVGDHQADGVADGGAHKLRQVAVRAAIVAACGGGGGSRVGRAHLLHNLVHDLADQFVFHLCSLRTLI